MRMFFDTRIYGKAIRTLAEKIIPLPGVSIDVAVAA